MTGDGKRRWIIVLKNGTQIAFEAAWNYNGNYSPSNMIQHHREYMDTGAKPSPPWAYRFPESNASGSKPVAIVSVDIADVAAIVQIFGAS